MRISTTFLFVLGSLFSAACSGNNDSLGTKGNNQGQGQNKCGGTDPSTLGCGAGDVCPTGMVCDPNACHPSTCSCDEATGSWQCTADCGFNTCVPDTGGPVCEGPDPSLGCDGGCPTGSSCDPNACKPSSCACGESGWICTDDCGGGGACVPNTNPKTCEGQDPSLGCDGGCPTGQICDPNACKPSSCGCDTTTGGWVCTDDCGSGGACVDDNTKICTTPDPSLGCDGGCPAGYQCDTNACKPSACFCDNNSGGWACTDDCGSSGVCVAE